MIKQSYFFAIFTAVVLTAGTTADAGSLKDDGPVAGACTGGQFAGHYIGANIGYVSHDGEIPDEDGDVKYDDAGFAGGIHYGYNVQCGRFVVGMESDISFIGSEPSVTQREGPNFATLENEIEWLSTSRLRVGLAHDNILLYATGGLASAKIEHTFSGNIEGIRFSISDDDVEWGWTAGAGVEMLREGGWSLRAEALYVDFGDTQRTFSSGAIETDGEISDDLWIGRVGLSYQYDLNEVLGRFRR